MKTPPPCGEWRELLSAYQDKDISAEDAGRVEEHLKGCEACRAALAAMDKDKSLFMKCYTAPAEDVDLRGSVMEELQMTQKSTDQVPVSVLRWSLGFAGAALLACVVLAVLLTFGRQGGPPAGVQVARVLEGDDGNLIVKADDVDGRMPIEEWAGHEVKQKSPRIGNIRYRLSSEIRPLSAQVITAQAGTPPSNQVSDGRITVMADRATPSDQSFFAPVSRNYGIPGGVKLSYDLDIGLRVKDALAGAREAQGIVNSNGGFVIDFEYAAGEDGQIPTAYINGKVPADRADAALKAIENLGKVDELCIAGEDITSAIAQQLDEKERELKHAEELAGIRNRAGKPNQAMNAEEQRNWAMRNADAARRALLGLKAKNKLVKFSARISEGKARERLHFNTVINGSGQMMRFVLNLLGIAALLVLLVGVCVAPIWVWKRVRRLV